MSAPQQKPFRGITPTREHPLSRGSIGSYLMNESAGDIVFDTSGNHNPGTNLGANWVASGLNFSGAERVELERVPIGNRDAFTISVRFNGAANGFMYAEGYSADARWAIFLGIEANDPWSAWFFVKEDNVWKSEMTGTTTVNDGWHTVSLSQKNKSYRTMYIDGIPEVTDTTTIGDMSTLDTANIGVLERSAFDAYFVGDISHLHLHDRAFSDEDAQQYNRDPHGMFEQIISPALLYSGWGGTINGITNPASILGIDVANIVKVNGL